MPKKAKDKRQAKRPINLVASRKKGKMEKPTELFAQIYDFDNLLAAHRKTMEGKKNNPEVQKFEAKREENLINIQNQLIWHTYHPSPTKLLHITDPKPREINAPAYRDRVLLQAMHIALAPLFERKMIHHTYACRKGKGAHATADKAQEYICEVNNSGRYYVLKCDIRHCYASINQDVLKTIIRKTIKEPDVLWLLDVIIDNYGENGVGIPLGAVMSQLFANIYLGELDHLIKDGYGFKRYLRYMDDFVLIGSDKNDLRLMLTVIRYWLRETLKLELNQKTRILNGSEGLDFCGYRIWPDYRLPRKRNIRKTNRKLRKMVKLCKDGKCTPEAIKQVWASYLGYTKHCNAHNTTVFIYAELQKLIKGE